MNKDTDISLSRMPILKRAESFWNSKSPTEKLRCKKKYQHILNKVGDSTYSWDKDFSNLSFRQKNILIKGELIRTYDSLSNQQKTKIKNKYNLSTFSSKWFKLPPKDKRILLLEILK